MASAAIVAALLALAVPTMASAWRVEQPAKTLVPVGTVLTAASTNVEFTHTQLGTLKVVK
jgi:hypothetical protein